MRIHSLQHVPFEDLANIEVWAGEKGHEVSKTLLFNDEALPHIEDFDWLVVMGGPMGVHDEDTYPWLIKERRFIEQSISLKKVVIGVCLGAQLIADVLGARVYGNSYKEIGWFPVTLTSEADNSRTFNNVPRRFAAFHWHGDTFDIPQGGSRLAESEACPNQAFEYNGRVIGLQFHLESSAGSIDRLIGNCADEIVDGKYIQSADQMRSVFNNVDDIRRILYMLLDNVEKEQGR